MSIKARIAAASRKLEARRTEGTQPIGITLFVLSVVAPDDARCMTWGYGEERGPAGLLGRLTEVKLYAADSAGFDQVKAAYKQHEAAYTLH